MPTMPNVVGLNIDEATAALEDGGRGQYRVSGLFWHVAYFNPMGSIRNFYLGFSLGRISMEPSELESKGPV